MRWLIALLLAAGVLAAGQATLNKAKAQLVVEQAKDALKQKFLLRVAPGETESQNLTLIIRDAQGKEEQIQLQFEGQDPNGAATGDRIYSGVSYLPAAGSDRRFYLRGLEGKGSSRVLLEAILFKF